MQWGGELLWRLLGKKVYMVSVQLGECHGVGTYVLYKGKRCNFLLNPFLKYNFKFVECLNIVECIYMLSILIINVTCKWLALAWLLLTSNVKSNSSKVGNLLFGWFLIGIPTFEWCVVWCGSKNGPNTYISKKARVQTKLDYKTLIMIAIQV
jgi:hypothetical protein